jgi:hypothetical protein
MNMRVTILDQDNHDPISDVVCQIFDKSDNLLSYSMTNGKGEVILNIKTKSSYVIFSLLGYEKSKLLVSSLSLQKKNTIFLKPKNQELKEIIVKAPPISRKSDTLVYNVSSFIGQQDKYIEDILKKLPGVTVGENGSISYQGRAISKFYIEGQDLLGNRYNQATQNLPAEAVSQIHLMENNQNVKVLKDRVFEERAAINIKLKKGYRIRPFGELSGGIGVQPTIWENRIFLAQIGASNQLMITGKMNNHGVDLSQETEEHLDLSNADMYEDIPSGFLNVGASSPPLEKERFLNNKAYSWGMNDLVKTGENSSFRVNVLGYIDRIREGNDLEIQYGGVSPVNLYEKNTIKNAFQTYTPILKYELNSDNTFFSNEFRGSFSRFNQHRGVISNTQALEQEVKIRPQYFQNRLSSTFLFGNSLFNLKSYVRYYKREELLHSAGLMYSLDETYKTGIFTVKNRLSTTIPFLGNNFDLGFLADFNRNDYKNGNSSLEKRAETKEINIGILPIIYSVYSKGHISFSLPVTWNSAHLDFQEANYHDGSNYFSFSPSLRMKHDFNEHLAFKFSTFYSMNNDVDVYYSESPLYKDYRIIYHSLNKIYRKKRLQNSLSLIYSDLVRMVFANLTLSHSYTKNSYYRDYNYKEKETIITPVDSMNHRNLIYVGGSVDKTFTHLGLSIKTGIDYTRTNYLASQSGTPFNNTSHILSISANSVFQKLRWAKLIYTFTGNIMWQDNKFKQVNAISNLHNELKFFFLVTPKININTYYQNTINEIGKSKYKHSNFVDIEIQYKPTKRVEFLGKLNNIFNNDNYIITSVIGLNYQSYQLPLRSREFLLSCLFRL